MLVVCLCCLRVVGFATKTGKVVCYGNECPLSIFQNMVKDWCNHTTSNRKGNYYQHLLFHLGYWKPEGIEVRDEPFQQFMT